MTFSIRSFAYRTSVMFTQKFSRAAAKEFPFTAGQLREMTGHCSPRVHLHGIGAYDGETVCRMYEETAGRIIFDCEALAQTPGTS